MIMHQDKELDDFQDRPHPLDRVGLWSYLTFSWVSTCINITKKFQFSQEMHPRPANNDITDKAFNRLKARLSPKKRLWWSVAQTFWPDFWQSLLLNAAFALLNLLVSLCFIELAVELQKQLAENGSISRPKEPALLAAGICASSLAMTYCDQLANFERSRMGFRVSTALKSILFNKILKMPLVRPSTHSTGSLVNNAQVDCQQFTTCTIGVCSLFKEGMNFIVTIGLGVWLFHWVYLSLAVILILHFLPLIIILRINYSLNEKWMLKKDERMAFFRNLYSIIKFVKVTATET